MTQSWGPPPNYPPPRPPQPQYQLAVPESDYYYPVGDSPLRRALYFLGGSCFSVVLVSCCVCVLAALWIADDRLGITTAGPEANNPNIAPITTFPPPDTPVFVQPTPPLQQQPDLQPPQTEPQPPALTPTPSLPNPPVAIGQPAVADDVGVELTVFDIQRNVQPINLQTPDGTEFVAVSIQLKNIRGDASKGYTIESFHLQDAEDNAFTPNADADNGRRLENGEIAPGAAIEGDLLFHIPLGRTPLTLVWQMADSAEVFFVQLQ